MPTTEELLLEVAIIPATEEGTQQLAAEMAIAEEALQLSRTVLAETEVAVQAARERVRRLQHRYDTLRTEAQKDRKESFRKIATNASRISLSEMASTYLNQDAQATLLEGARGYAEALLRDAESIQRAAVREQLVMTRRWVYASGRAEAHKAWILAAAVLRNDENASIDLGKSKTAAHAEMLADLDLQLSQSQGAAQ